MILVLFLSVSLLPLLSQITVPKVVESCSEGDPLNNLSWGSSGRAPHLQERSVESQEKAESVTLAGVCSFLDTPVTNYNTQLHGKIYVYKFQLKSAFLVLM